MRTSLSGYCGPNPSILAIELEGISDGCTSPPRGGPTSPTLRSCPRLHELAYRDWAASRSFHALSVANTITLNVCQVPHRHARPLLPSQAMATPPPYPYEPNPTLMPSSPCLIPWPQWYRTIMVGSGGAHIASCAHNEPSNITLAPHAHGVIVTELINWADT